MRCHSCGTEVREGQRFCMDCGASLRGVADITGEVPITRRQPATAAVTDDGTREVVAMPPPTMPPGASGTDTTNQLRVVEATAAPITITTTPPPVNVLTEAPTGSTAAVPAALTATTTVGAVTSPAPGATVAVGAPNAATTELGALPARQATDTGPIAAGAPGPARAEAVERRRFRLRPLLVVSILAAGATVVGVLTTLIELTPPPTGPNPAYMVNDFGTNNTAAAIIAAATMVVGALAWCFGFRWGAGLAGGAGAALAGWVALVIGLAEWPIKTAELSGASVERSPGYWALVGAGAAGAVVLLMSLARAGSDRRSGLDPWIAALGAVSVLIAAGGPLIPEGTADWSGNWSSDTLGVDLPTMFFAGRLIQLGLVAVCGVVGFLLVRRYGLGMAIGGAVTAGWMLATAATGQTDSPIGPAYENPGSVDLEPHAVTIVGFALLGFFALVAVVMALLDADR